MPGSDKVVVLRAFSWVLESLTKAKFLTWERLTFTCLGSAQRSTVVSFLTRLDVHFLVDLMIVIEIKEVQPVGYKHSEGVPDALNFDHCFVKSKPARVATAFVKGLAASFAVLLVSGFPICFQNQFIVGLISFIALAFAANEVTEQCLTRTRCGSTGATAPKLSLRSINPVFAAIPVIFMLSTMNLQTLVVALSNTIEVLGIACGVPFLLYGLVKMTQESNFGRTHVYVGSASAFGGVALSVVVNIIVANGMDASIFSATNYFSNAIATIYAPDVVLPLEQ